jgi:hypothetical protein
VPPSTLEPHAQRLSEREVKKMSCKAKRLIAAAIAAISIAAVPTIAAINASPALACQPSSGGCYG